MPLPDSNGRLDVEVVLTTGWPENTASRAGSPTHRTQTAHVGLARVVPRVEATQPTRGGSRPTRIRPAFAKMDALRRPWRLRDAHRSPVAASLAVESGVVATGRRA